MRLTPGTIGKGFRGFGWIDRARRASVGLATHRRAPVERGAIAQQDRLIALYQRDLVLRRLRIDAARGRRGAMLAGVARSGFADAAGRLQQPERVQVIGISSPTPQDSLSRNDARLVEKR